MMGNRAVIIGAGGRMGQALTRCLQEGAVPELELGAAVEQPGHPSLSKASGFTLVDNLDAARDAGDVFIDFSFHSATPGNALQLADWGKPMVIGTTGLEAEEQAAIVDASQRIAIVQAPNMSLGVNLLFSLVEQAAAALKGKGYDIEIIEQHHRRKLDAPSGTALGLGKAAANGLQVDLDKVAKHGRRGIQDEERTADEIGFHAVRGGDVVGDHQVSFSAEGEMLTLGHRATSRDTFAMGALRAAVWVMDKKAGLYSMQDVLGIDEVATKKCGGS